MPTTHSGFLIQSTYGSRGNFELVVVTLRAAEPLGDALLHLCRENSEWNGPVSLFQGATGVPGFIQSRHGARGNSGPEPRSMYLPRCMFGLHLLLLASIPCWAQGSASSDQGGWFARVARAQAAQPRWITPVVTVTPRLEEECRYDISEQTPPNGARTEIYGGSKGLELIPAEHIQLTAGVPPYEVHNQAGVHDGWGDLSFLVKYRVFSRDEDHGNYILTAFLGATLPTGEANNGAAHFTITPWVAAGKGWGNFSVQSTLGITLPAADTRQLGRPLLSNAAFQYRIWQKLWPEFEVNSTFWRSGELAGKKQVFLTPGLVIGRLHLTGRLRLALGAGFQIAATQFHTYNHKLVFTIRFPFA